MFKSMGGGACGWLVVGVMLAFTTRAEADVDVRQSVVRIEVTQVKPDYFEPWKRSQPSEVSGTGVIIDGNRILTNAHVVSHARKTTIQPANSARKYPAKVIGMSVAMDLAVLSVDDLDFFQGRPALEFDDELPAVKAPVNAYGFPTGGTQVSVTEGIVSRIEFDRYYYTTTGLRIQIDAALNPGNSGGPAVKDGKMVGLVFSRISSGDNIGYLIPIEEVRLFLDDIEDGHYEGKLQFWDETQTVENDALREQLKLSSDQGGVYVNRLGDGPPSGLQVGDVVTAIEGQSIDRQGKIQLRDDLRIPFAYHVQGHADRDTVELSVLRDGKAIDLQAVFRRDTKRLIPYLGDDAPQYFIVGPLAVMPASSELAQFLAASAKWNRYLLGTRSPLLARLFDQRQFDDEELVVSAAAFLPHSITQGYADPKFGVIDKFNGQHPRNVAHFIELVRDNRDEFCVVEFAGNNTETFVFHRQSLLDATDEVLDDNGIRRRASPDLLDVWEAE